MVLQKKLSWTDAGFLVFGGFSIVLFSAGAGLVEIGPWSLVIWLGVSLVGLLQARLIYKLARLLPDKAGGVATYAHEAFKRYPFLAFISSWSYWLAWTPAVALNCFLAAGLLKFLFPAIAVNTAFLAIVFVLLLYGLNYFGLGKAVIGSRILAVLITLPLWALFYLGFKQAVSIDVWQKIFNFHSISFLEWWKWFFLIAWTGYAVEIVASTVSELKDHHNHTGKIFKLASGLSLIAFILLPLALALVSDWPALSQDVFVGLLPVFASNFGQFGSVVLAVLLLTALIYSSLSFIIPSTRTMYQMSKDGLLPKR